MSVQPTDKRETNPRIKPKTYIVRMRMVEIVEWTIEARSKDEAIEIAMDTPTDSGNEWIDSTSYAARVKREDA
jgi:hypothetical protein